ncbi:MAG TPA: CBS domain-containing protein [Chloroflexota bacterium]|nr:CBS domain-containing protein [Chloroflexota bacterium]
MRRVNIQAAFLGEGGSSDSGDEEGLALAVRGGEIVLVLPAGTSDARAVQDASTLRGSLRLESGRVLTFEIHDGAVGAFFEDEPAELFDRREALPGDGLSSVSSRPVRRPTFGGAEALHGTIATARDVMTTDVISASPDESVDEAARLLNFHDVSGLPVCAGGRVIGVVSEADLIGKSGSIVGEVMTTPAVTVSVTTTLERVAEQLTQQRIRRLPVVDDNGQLVGVVSRRDVLRWAAARVPAATE